MNELQKSMNPTNLTIFKPTVLKNYPDSDAIDVGARAWGYVMCNNYPSGDMNTSKSLKSQSDCKRQATNISPFR